jgi:hypothetical protein
VDLLLSLPQWSSCPAIAREDGRKRPNVPGTHVLLAAKQGVGGRDEPGHDALGDFHAIETCSKFPASSRKETE